MWCPSSTWPSSPCIEWVRAWACVRVYELVVASVVCANVNVANWKHTVPCGLLYKARGVWPWLSLCVTECSFGTMRAACRTRSVLRTGGASGVQELVAMRQSAPSMDEQVRVVPVPVSVQTARAFAWVPIALPPNTRRWTRLQKRAITGSAFYRLSVHTPPTPPRYANTARPRLTPSRSPTRSTHLLTAG